jgi:HlyD family secretion protein
MDRELDASYRRRRLGRRWIWGLVSLGLILAVLLLLPGWLRPSLDRAALRTAKVDRGPVEGGIEASGTVIPAFESVLSSPVEARVEKILKRPGEPVRAGEEILRLDTSAARLEVERLDDQLARKANEKEQLRLSLDKTLRELKARIESQRLDSEVLGYRAGQNRKLRTDGLISEEALKASEVEARKAEIDLAQLEGSVGGELRSTEARLAGVDLELNTLRKEREEARRQLERATTRSDRPGVLTWVVAEEGATIPRGSVIARIADLDSFRVEGTVSDVHAPRLARGLPVRVTVDDENLNGTLAEIAPTIQNGIAHFYIDLEQASHPKLRNQLGVDVLVRTDSRRSALRLPKGPGVDPSRSAAVFVVEGDRAVRRTARFGAVGSDYVEILDGLDQGEEVILSDMNDYLHLAQVKLR